MLVWEAHRRYAGVLRGLRCVERWHWARRRGDDRSDQDACVGARAGGRGRPGRRHRDAAARSQPVGHVHQRRPGGEGGADRPRLRLAGDLDGMARQDASRSWSPSGACARRCATLASVALDRRGRRAARRHAGRGRPVPRRGGDGAASCPPVRMEREGIKERIASRLERIEAAYGRRIMRGTGVLATIGATAPSSACSAPSGAS